MSGLQLSLLALGATGIVAVVLFNWFQEWRFRRKTEIAFQRQQHEDVLLGSRVEPRLKTPMETASLDLHAAPGISAPVATPDIEAGVGEIDAMLDFVISLDFPKSIEGELLHAQQRLALPIGKTVQCYGLSAERNAWEIPVDGTQYRQLKAAIQLADRSGPITTEQLNKFWEIWRNFAVQVNAVIDCPSIPAALASAQDLDRFCGEVDIEIGMNVVASENTFFSATKIRALAESAGFRLEPDGVFYYDDEQGHALFTLRNSDQPFFPEQIKILTTPCITFLLDVPQVAEGWRVFDRMVTLAKNIASSLGGSLVDDNRAALNDAGVEQIRTPLRAIYASMDARGIHAGSRRAQRLFV